MNAAMARRYSVPVGPKFNGLDAASQSMEQSLKTFLQVKRIDDARLASNQDATDGAGHIDPAFRSARYKAAARSLREPLGAVSKHIEGMLQQGADARDELRLGCDTIGCIHGLLQRMRQELSPAEVQDKQIERCWSACEQSAAVLKDLGLAEQLREAAQRMAELNFSHCASEPLGGLPSTSRAEKVAQLREITGDVTLPETRAALLAEIDDVKTREEALTAIRRLFDYYADNLGFLEGQGLEVALEDMTNHVQKEWSARNDRLVKSGKRALGEPGDAFFKDFVRKSIDIDGDGCVTFEEAYVGFKNVVDDID